MGYYTYFGGEIEFDPPMSEDEVRNWNWLLEKDHSTTGLTERFGFDPWCEWRMAEDAIVSPQDSVKGYDAEEWMAFIVAELAKKGHTCNGVIDADGEETEDRWRIVVEDNHVYTERAHFVFGDRSPVEIDLNAGNKS